MPARLHCTSLHTATVAFGNTLGIRALRRPLDRQLQYRRDNRSDLWLRSLLQLAQICEHLSVIATQSAHLHLRLHLRLHLSCKLLLQ